MFTAKMVNGILQTTHYIDREVLDPETGLVTIEPPVCPEGETEITLPTDAISLHFRGAWELGPEGIRVNLDKAKAQRAAFIRELVDVRLARIDAQTDRAVREALITGEKIRVEQLETDAAALRSVRSNPGVDSITGLEALAAYLPAVLMGS